MNRLRFALVLSVLLAALLLVPAAGEATPPQKGARYAGMITVQRVEGRAFRFPLFFDVSANGREAGPFVFPDGAPFGTKCAEGPLGEPVGKRLVTVEGGGIDAYFPLKIEDPSVAGEPELGNVHLSGRFRPHGRFAATLENRTTAKVCRGEWSFELRVQP
jgi:hypothetical protein